MEAPTKAYYPLLLDGREREALLRALYHTDHSSNELLLGIRAKLVMTIAEIESQPEQARTDQLFADLARRLAQRL